MFLDKPPVTHEHLPHIVRIKAGQTTNARLAGQPLRTLTHFVEGRTYPCLRHAIGECPICDNVANPRYYSYWPVSGSTGLQAAVELTEQAELQLLQVLPNPDHFFGQLVTFHRPSGRRNNPITVSLPCVLPSDEDNRKKNLTPIPTDSVQRTLFRLWQFPPFVNGEPSHEYLERVTPILHARYLALVGDRRNTG